MQMKVVARKWTSRCTLHTVFEVGKIVQHLRERVFVCLSAFPIHNRLLIDDCPAKCFFKNEEIYKKAKKQFFL